MKQLFTFCFLLLTAAAIAQVQRTQLEVFGEWNNNDDVSAVQEVDNDGNLYVAGFSGSSMLLMKYNPDGSIRWTRTQYSSPSAGAITDMKIDDGGNIYVAGPVNDPVDRMTVLKYDPHGNVLWTASITDSSTYVRDEVMIPWIARTM
jgi:outer membrane protein assembly factor BamB